MKRTANAFLIATALTMLWCTAARAVATEDPEEAIVIVHGMDRTIVEFRVGGILRVIKIVPEHGRPYYLVPADGATPVDGLDHVLFHQRGNGHWHIVLAPKRRRKANVFS